MCGTGTIRKKEKQNLWLVKPLICSFLLITCSNFSESQLIFISEGTSQVVGQTDTLKKFVSQQKQISENTPGSAKISYLKQLNIFMQKCFSKLILSHIKRQENAFAVWFYLDLNLFCELLIAPIFAALFRLNQVPVTPVQYWWNTADSEGCRGEEYQRN